MGGYDDLHDHVVQQPALFKTELGVHIYQDTDGRTTMAPSDWTVKVTRGGSLVYCYGILCSVTLIWKGRIRTPYESSKYLSASIEICTHHFQVADEPKGLFKRIEPVESEVPGWMSQPLYSWKPEGKFTCSSAVSRAS